jgi:hypothetical protein
MLFNIKLTAGRFTEVAKQGRHINLVLAAGELTVRALTSEGQIMETQMIAGMSFPFQSDYSKVAFSSDSDQQVKVWLAMFPLTYSPDTSREVGSSSVQSTYAEAYSGAPQLLLPASVGRNKVTVSPSADILIGGVNLDTKNGIPIATGQVFELKTQGAVYALETSGAYPPTIAVEATQADFENPTIIAKPAGTKIIVADGAAGEYWLHDGVLSSALGKFNRYNATTHAALGSFLSPIPNAFEGSIFSLGDGFQYLHTFSDLSHTDWVTVDPVAHTYSAELVGNYGGYSFSAAFGDKRAALHAQTRTLYVSNAGGAFAAGAVVVPSGAETIEGFDMDSSGNIYVLSSARLYKTVDDGANWTSIVNSYAVNTAGYNALAISKNNDYIYYATSVTSPSGDSAYTIAVSVNGTTFSLLEIDNVGTPAAYYMNCIGGTLYLVGRYKVHQYNPESGGLISYERLESTQVFNMHAGNDSRLYWHDTTQIYIIEGEQVLSGGLAVAILAEIN